VFFPKNLVFRNAYGTLAQLREFLADPANADQKIQPGELFVLIDDGHPILLTYFQEIDDVGSPMATLPLAAWAGYAKWNYVENSGLIVNALGVWGVNEPFPYLLGDSSVNEFYDTNLIPDAEGRQVGDTLVWTGEGDFRYYPDNPPHEGKWVLAPGFGNDAYFDSDTSLPAFKGNFGWDNFVDAKITEPILDKSGIYWDQTQLLWVNKYFEQRLDNRSDVDINPTELETLDALTYFEEEQKWGVKPLSTEGVLAVPDGRRGRRADLEYIVIPGIPSSLVDGPSGFWEGKFFSETTDFHPIGSEWFVNGWDLTGTEIRTEFSNGGGWAKFPDGAWRIANLSRQIPLNQLNEGCLTWKLRDFIEGQELDYKTLKMPIRRAGEGLSGEAGSGYFEETTYHGDWTMQFWFRLDTNSRFFNVNKPFSLVTIENTRIRGSLGGGAFIDPVIDLEVSAPDADHLAIRDIEENRDYHFALVNSAQTGKSRVYIDGQLVSIQGTLEDGTDFSRIEIGSSMNGYIADFVVTLCDEYKVDDGEGYEGQGFLEKFTPPVGWGRRKVQAPRAAVKTLGVSEKGRFAWVGSDNPLVWKTAEASNLNRIELSTKLPFDFISGRGARAWSWNEDKQIFEDQEYLNSGVFLPPAGGLGAQIRDIEELRSRHGMPFTEEDLEEGRAPYIAIFNPKYQPNGLGQHDGGFYFYEYGYSSSARKMIASTNFMRSDDSPWSDSEADRFLTGLPRIVRNQKYPEGAWYSAEKVENYSNRFYRWIPGYYNNFEQTSYSLGFSTDKYKGQVVGIRFGYDGTVFTTTAPPSVYATTRTLLRTGWCSIYTKDNVFIVSVSVGRPDGSTSDCLPEGLTQEEREELIKSDVGFCGSITFDVHVDLTDPSETYELVVIYDINSGIHVYWNGQRYLIDEHDISYGLIDDIAPGGLPTYIRAPNRSTSKAGYRFQIYSGCYLEKFCVMNALPEGWLAELAEFDFDLIYDLDEQMPGLELKHGTLGRTHLLSRKEYSFSSSTNDSGFGEYRSFINLDPIGRGSRSALPLVEDDYDFSRYGDKLNFYVTSNQGRYSTPSSLNLEYYQGPRPNNSSTWYLSRYAEATVDNFPEDVLSLRDSNQDGDVLVWNRDTGRWIPQQQTEFFSWEINQRDNLSPADNDILRWDDQYKEWVTTQGIQEIQIGFGDLTDVVVSNVKSNDLVQYDETTGIWKNVAITDIGYVKQLDDVQIDFYQGKDRLTYDSRANKWKPVAPISYYKYQLDFLRDVDYPDRIISGYILVYRAGLWIPEQRRYIDSGFLIGIYETYRWHFFQATRQINNVFSIGNPATTLQGLIDPITGEIVDNPDVSELDGLFVNWTDAPAPPVTASGDGGNFQYGETEAGFPMQLFGGGNFELGEEDVPVEWLAGMDSGEFTEDATLPPQPISEGVYVAALPFAKYISDYRDEEAAEYNALYSLDGRTWEADPERLIDHPRLSGRFPDNLVNDPNCIPPGAISDESAFFENRAASDLNGGRTMRSGLFTEETAETEITDQDFTIDFTWKQSSVYTEGRTRRGVYQYIVGATSENSANPGSGLQWEVRISTTGLNDAVDDAFITNDTIGEDHYLFFYFQDEEGVKHEIAVNWGPNGFRNGCEYEDYQYPKDKRSDYEWTHVSIQRNYNRGSFIFYCNGRRQEVFTPLARIPFRSIAGENGARLGVGCIPTPNIPEYTGFDGWIHSLRVVKNECIRGKGSEQIPIGNYGIPFNETSAT